MRQGIAEQLARDASGPLVRIADSASVVGKKYELLRGTIYADTHAATHKVYELATTPVHLPTGAKALPTGTLLVHDHWNIEPSVSQEVVCIHEVNAYSHGTTGQVDWIILPFGGTDTTKTLNCQLYNNAKKYSDDSVKVKLLDFSGNPVGTEIDCYDLHNEFSSGGKDDAFGQLTLFRDADTGLTRPCFISLQCIAQVITGTLAENMGATTTDVASCTDAVGFGPSFENEAVPATVHVTADAKLGAGMRLGEAFVAVLEDPDAAVPLYRLIMRDGSEINVQLAGNKLKSDATRTCFVCEDDLTATAIVVTVADPHLTYEGASGQKGVAGFKRDETTQLHRLEFTHINQFAEYIAGTLTTDMTSGSATAAVDDYWGGHHEGVNPGSTVTVVPGVDCHEDLLTGDTVVAVRLNSITPTYRVVSSCRDGGGGPITVACGIEVNEDGHVAIDPSIACDGLYWDSENCCLGVYLPDNGYLYIDGSGRLDMNLPTIEVKSFDSCTLAIEDDELVLTIKYKTCTVFAPDAETACGGIEESTCSLAGVTDCTAE